MVSKHFKKNISAAKTFLDKVINKDKNIWIFGSGDGKYYSQNSKYLYEYVLQRKNSSIRPIWLTSNKDVEKLLRKQNKECYLFYSGKGVYYSLIAGIAVVSSSWIELPLTTFIFNKRIKLVQLWHGTPLKKLDLKKNNFAKKIFFKAFRLYLGREYDIIASATSKNTKIYQEKNIFNAKKRSIAIVGQPRNDALFNKPDMALLSKLVGKKTISNLIVFLPTFRNYPTDFFGAKLKFNYKKVNSFLERNKCVLLVKFHDVEILRREKFSQNKNIIIANKLQDPYVILSRADILITDYSSIYFDYLLLDKPIIFFTFDLQKYEKNNGFYYDYDEVTPGPKVKNWDELLEALRLALDGRDEYKKQRMQVNKLFNKYQDGNSSERIYELLTKNIK